jgi:hypothetical protein
LASFRTWRKRLFLYWLPTSPWIISCFKHISDTSKSIFYLYSLIRINWL